MKIKKYIYVLFALFVFPLELIAGSDDKAEKTLTKELENLIDNSSDNDYSELYDIEPIEHYDENNIEEKVRRHENNIILEKLERKEKIQEFLNQNYKTNI